MTVGIDLERQLRIDDLEKKVLRSFRKDLESRLAGQLREELIALSGHREHRGRRELIPSDELIEQLRIQGDRGACSRRRLRREQRQLPIQ